MKIIWVLFSLLASVVLSTGHIRKTTAPKDSYQDSLQTERDKYLAQIRMAIAGKENALVDSVFHNLKVLGGFPQAICCLL